MFRLLLILIVAALGQDLGCLQGPCNQIVLNDIKPLVLKCEHPYIRFMDLAITTIPFGAFRICSQTKLLDFSNNQIQEIRSSAFEGLYSLTDLYLLYNQIKEIEPGTFYPLTKLEILVLTGNLLTTLPQWEIKSKNMRFLNCNNNRMINIPNNILQTLNVIDLLDLSNNKLVKLGKKALINVEGGCTINLCNNLLKSIEFEIAMPYSKGLTTFLASGNRIENITKSSLGTLHHLKIVCLDLSYNRIDFIESNSFDSHMYLKDLYLSNNKLTKLPPQIFQNLFQLSSIDLSHNRFMNNIFDLYYSNSIKYLNYSHNLISNLDDFSWIPEWGYIEELNVMNNKLTYLDGNLVSRQIKSISIVYNDWECSVLYTLLMKLENRGIQVLRINDGRGLKINGISCKTRQELSEGILKVTKKKLNASRIKKEPVDTPMKLYKIFKNTMIQINLYISFAIIILLLIPFFF